MANPHMSADKELFLDILTKEEREALLTKKMEEIRKKNEALRKRHEEIEADKRQAEKMIKPGSPKKDIKTVEFNTGKKEEFHRHSGSDFDYLRNRTDFEYLRSRTDFELPFDGEVKRRQKVPGRGKGPGGRGKERPKSLGPPPDPAYNFLADKRREGPAPERGDRDSGGGGGGGGSSGRGGRGGGGGGLGGGNIEDLRERDSGRLKDHRRHPKNYGGTDFQNVKTKMKIAREKQGFTGSSPQSKMEMTISMSGRERRQYMEWKAERERVDKERIDRQKSASGEWRREWDAEKIPQDFEEGSSLKRQDSNRRPDNGKSFQGTCQVKVYGDPGRPSRQNPSLGLADVIPRKAEIDTSAGRTSNLLKGGAPPPVWLAGITHTGRTNGAGRIGSGRFDRGERDDRQRGEAPGSKENAELKRTKVGEKIEKGKRPLGRGRGRGRGISATPRNRVLPPNLANDSRKVECTRDLLVVKIDNSPGAGDDVEVEYSDTDAISGKSANHSSSSVGIAIPTSQSHSHASATSPYSKSCPTHSSTAPAEKMWGTIQENSWDQSQATKQNGERHHEDEDDEDVMLEDEYIEDGELYEGMYEDAENDPHYGLMHGMVEGDDWEECAEDEEYYVDGNDLVYDDVDKANEALRIECQLNPEAPAFVPTSPELIKSPPGDTDNPKWVSEIAPNISKSSEGDNNNNDEETPKDPIDNCCSSSSKLSSSSTIVDGKDKVQDAKAANAAPSSSSTSSFESNSGQGGPEAKSPVSSALKADPKDTDSKEAKDTDSKEAKDTDSKEAKDTNIESKEAKDTDIESKEAKDTDIESKEAKDTDIESKEAKVTDIESKEAKDTDIESKEAKDTEIESKEAKDTDIESKEAKDTDKESNTELTHHKSNESIEMKSTSVSDEDDEFKDTKEILDEDHSKEDNDNDNMENKSITENSNNNNNSKDNISSDSMSQKSSVILEENIKMQNNNSEKNLVKELSNLSSTAKSSADESKSYSSNAVRTVKETIQTVKDAGAWKLSVKDDVESVSLYKHQINDFNESNSLDRSISSEGSGKSLANELLEAEFGKAQTLKMAVHTTKTSSSSSSSTNPPVTCQDSDPAARDVQAINKQSTGTGIDGAKTEQSEVSDLSNAGPTKAEASV